MLENIPQWEFQMQFTFRKDKEKQQIVEGLIIKRKRLINYLPNK